MRNKFAGECYKCGERVEVGSGYFERHQGSWRTQHVGCKNESAVSLGKIKSDKKAEAARINGKKGGRPKKQPQEN